MGVIAVEGATGAIPIDGVTEWAHCCHIARDNNPLAMNRAANNISTLLTKNQIKDGKTYWALPIDDVHYLCGYYCNRSVIWK